MIDWMDDTNLLQDWFDFIMKNYCPFKNSMLARKLYAIVFNKLNWYNKIFKNKSNIHGLPTIKLVYSTIYA